MKDYYKELELPKESTQDEIREQYRFLANAWHPDKFINPRQKERAEEKFKNINEAYSILGNKEKRERYDRTYFGVFAQQVNQSKNPASSNPVWQGNVKKESPRWGIDEKPNEKNENKRNISILMMLAGFTIFMVILYNRYSENNTDKYQLIPTYSSNKSDNSEVNPTSSNQNVAVNSILVSPMLAQNSEVLLNDDRTWFLYDIGTVHQNDNHIIITISDLKEDPVMWGTGWCSKNKSLLEANFKALEITAIINNEILDESSFKLVNYENEIEIEGIGKQKAYCRTSYVGLTNWGIGSHKLTFKLKAKEEIFDGWDTIPPGTEFEEIYYVTKKENSIIPSANKPTPTSGKFLPTIPTRYLCTHVSKITSKDIGKCTCIYGILLGIEQTDMGEKYLFESSDFFMLSYNDAQYKYRDFGFISIGKCVEIIGCIDNYGSRPVIVYDKNVTMKDCEVKP